MEGSSFSYSSNTTPSLPRRRRFRFKIPQFKSPLFFKLLVPVVILVVLSLSIYMLAHKNKGSVSGASTTKDGQFAVKEPKEKITLNREFQFPLKDDKAHEVGRFSYILESAELTDEIVLKGSRATAVKGREFLIVNLKLVNTQNYGIQINSRDYIRLSVNGDMKELLAPDIHNDPVEVQAISTKYTRVGFPINTTDKNLSLQIGEINGVKQTIKLTFKDK